MRISRNANFYQLVKQKRKNAHKWHAHFDHKGGVYFFSFYQLCRLYRLGRHYVVCRSGRLYRITLEKLRQEYGLRQPPYHPASR